MFAGAVVAPAGTCSDETWSPDCAATIYGAPGESAAGQRAAKPDEFWQRVSLTM